MPQLPQPEILLPNRKKPCDVSQKDPTQPKKKNRKRVAERLAAEEAAKDQQNEQEQK